MEDPTSSLLQVALGIAPPWRVEEISFDADRHRLDIRLGFERGARFECPECKRGACAVHDVADKEWRHLNFRTRPTCMPGCRGPTARITACA